MGGVWGVGRASAPFWIPQSERLSAAACSAAKRAAAAGMQTLVSGTILAVPPGGILDLPGVLYRRPIEWEGEKPAEWDDVGERVASVARSQDSFPWPKR